LQIEFSEKFIKDIENIEEKKILIKLENIIENIKNKKPIKMKKIKGFKNFYRIRIGDYRLGIEMDKEKVIIKRFLHRKKIYRLFP
jgi:mRNA interferase RelE/StbE